MEEGPKRQRDIGINGSDIDGAERESRAITENKMQDVGHRGALQAPKSVDKKFTCNIVGKGEPN